MRSASVLGMVVGVAGLLVPFVSPAAELVEEKSWSTEAVVKQGFTDLGNYLIRLNTFDDPASLAEGLAAMNERYDSAPIPKVGCTAMATRNREGEVIFGRNMDLEISQSPAYVIETTYGKYRTIGVSYMPKSSVYAELREQDDLKPKAKAMLPFGATDVMNEKGLYLEADMRTTYEFMSNYGLHTQHGETARADGTPWSQLRACMNAIPQLAA